MKKITTFVLLMVNFRLPKYTGIKVLLLAIFFGYYTNIALFTHIHVVGNEVIVHAHPFVKTTASSTDGTATPIQHSHNNLELRLLADLSNFVSTGEAVLPSIEIFIPATPVHHNLHTEATPVTVIYGNTLLRGPPAV